MIKRIKQYNLDAEKHGEYLFAREDFRDYVENWESELLRGISTLAVLAVIESQGKSYGYEILNELKVKTNNMLILEEGTLYPTLRKLKVMGILDTSTDYEGKRKKINYELTPYGQHIFNHISGLFTKLMESMSEMFKIKVQLHNEKFVYCPNCTMRYAEEDLDEYQHYCSACGFYLKDHIDRLRKRGVKDE